MTAGVIIDSIITSGGGFHHSFSTILLLHSKRSIQYNFVFFTMLPENVPFFKKHGIEVILIKLTIFNRAVIKLRRFGMFRRLLNKVPVLGVNHFDAILEQKNIDLLYFLSYSHYALFTEKFNFIFSVWDLNHRDYPEFPLFHHDFFFENMEKRIRSVLPKATAILVDSEIGKRNVIQRYGIDRHRIYVVPFLPAESVSSESGKEMINIKEKYSINNPYIYYPAQFWAHKNHFYILEGLKILKEKYNILVEAIFSGADKGNLSYVMSKAKEFNIVDQIKYIGFVDDNEIPHLYRQALALVMPTYLGPTNIPPLEAFALGCAVLYSDLEGVREQVAGAALLVDLKDPESMALQLMKVLNEDPQIELFKRKGREIVNAWTKEDVWYNLKKIFDDYYILKKSWMA